MGKHYLNEQNSVYQSWYGLVNLMLTFEVRNIFIDLWGNNLTSTRYHVFSFQAPGNHYPGKPQTDTGFSLPGQRKGCQVNQFALCNAGAGHGGALLNVFLGGERNPNYYKLPNNEIIDIVREETREMMQLKVFEPDLLKIYRYSHAIPQYDADSFQRLKAIMDLQIKHPGLYLAGNIKERIGMADRIAQARRLADLIEQW